MNIYEVTTKLIGPIRPCGECQADQARYKNLEEAINVVDRLVYDLNDIAAESGCEEASRNKIATRADKYLDDLRYALNSSAEGSGKFDVLVRTNAAHMDELQKAFDQVKTLAKALRKAGDCFRRIEDTRFGYDGDCGVVGIANEGSEVCAAAGRAAAEGSADETDESKSGAGSASDKLRHGGE